MVAYASSQAHSSIEKGARVAGYDHIRLLDTGPEFALRPATLAAAIAWDRRAGLEPAFLCSALGTTGTTGVDPVRALGEIVEQQPAEALLNRPQHPYARALLASSLTEEPLRPSGNIRRTAGLARLRCRVGVRPGRTDRGS